MNKSVSTLMAVVATALALGGMAISHSGHQPGWQSAGFIVGSAMLVLVGQKRKPQQPKLSFAWLIIYLVVAMLFLSVPFLLLKAPIF